MSKKLSLLFILNLLIFQGIPVYAVNYEEISPIKIIFQLIFYIVIFILVIFFTLYGTKLIAKNFKGVVSSKYMSLLDVLNISNGTKIVIVKVNKKVYILATSNNITNVIDIVDEDDFPIYDESFDNYLSKYLNKNNNEYGINKKLEGLLNKININKDKEGKDDEKRY